MTKTAILTVNPLQIQAVLSSPAMVARGMTIAYNKVTLTGPAPTGGALFQ